MRSSTESLAVRKRTGVSLPSARRRCSTRQPVEVGQHDVEHDDVGLELPRERERLLALDRGLHVPALVAQRHLQQVAERDLVVDDERAHR